MKDILKHIGKPAHVLWFDEEAGKWDIDSTSIIAGAIPLKRLTVILFQDGKTLDNLPSRNVFITLEEAQEALRRKNKSKHDII